MRELFLPAAACLSMLLARSPVRAQGAPDSTYTTYKSLTVSLGALRENRRDDADSPLGYEGTGPGARIVYDWSGAKHHGYVSIAGGGSTLTPTESPTEGNTPSQETFSLYALRAGMDWRLPHHAEGRGEFSLGAEFAATVTVVRHLYSGQDLSQQNFDLSVLTLAPTARWNRRIGPGDLSASVALPLIALVDHPYADVRFATQLVNVHYAPLTQFHQVNGELAYDLMTQRSVGLEARYRIEAVELNDLQPIRRVSQSFSLGVVVRFRTRAR